MNDNNPRIIRPLLFNNNDTYVINNTTYTVVSKFKGFKIFDEDRLNTKIGRILQSDFIPLTITEEDNTMAEEYMCLTAGKEDYAVKKEI